MSNLDVALRLRLVNQLGGPAKDAKKELEGIGAAAKKLDGAKAGKLAADLTKAKLEAKQTGAALEKAAAGAKKLDPAKADRLARGLGKSKAEALGSERALRQVVNALRQLDGTRAERLVNSLRRANTAADSLARSLRRVRAEGHAAGDGHGGPAKRSTASGGGAGATLIAGGARVMGAVGGIYLGVRTAASGISSVVEQDKAWAEVRKKVTGTPEQLSDLQRQLRAQARRYGMSIVEAFEQAASAGAAGIDIKEIEEAVRTALMASKAWDTNAKETMQYMAQMKSAMGWNLDTLKEWADKVNALADASAASERALVDAAKRSTAPGAAAGVDADSVLAITAAQISGGMPEEVASRWFNTFSSKLAGANAGTKKQKEVLSKYLKLDPKVVAKGMEKDARATIMEVLKRFNELGQQQRIEFGVGFFGQEWWDETARAAKVIPEITRMFDILNDKAKWSGSMQSNLDITMSTTANHWDRIKAAASEAANQIDRATGASKGFNAATESLLSTFEGWLAKRGDGSKASPETPRVDQPAGPRSAYPGRFQAAAHAKATREALAGKPPPKSAFPGRFQSAAHAAALAQHAREVRASQTEYGAASPKRTDYSPVLPKNYSPLSPLAASEAEATMQRITRSITTEGAKAVSEARSIADQLRAIFNFTVSPQISPRLGGGVPSGGSAAPTPAPAAPSGKRASLGSSVHIGNLNLHGVSNPRQFARELAKLGNSSSALHDTVA